MENRRRPIAAGCVFVWLFVWLLSGCAGPPDAGLSANPDPPATGQSSASNRGPGLSTELLYDLLLADIAGQRGHDAVALASLYRAAHQSREQPIVTRALWLASRLEDHQRVIQLSRLMADIAPHNRRHHLALATAQFATGQGQEALALLVDLARRQRTGEEAVLQSIAELLARQPPEAKVLSRLGSAVQNWPQSPELHLTAALLADQRQQGAAFREWIDRALQLRPGWEVAAMLKLTDLANFAPQRMASWADGFLQAFPAARPFQMHYGNLLLHIDQPQASLTQFEIVLEQEPDSAEALLGSGMAYLAQENLPAALAQFSGSLALDPGNDPIRLRIAEIKIRQQAFDEAAAVLWEVGTETYYLTAQLRLAFVIARQDGLQAGIRHLQEIEVRSENERVRVILGKNSLYQDFDLPERAKAVLDAGLAEMPQQPDLLYNRALLAAQLDLLEQHERDMRTLINLQPDNAHAYNALGYTLADHNQRLDEALELITQALKMRPNDPHILDSMGWVNFRIGNNDQAIQYLRRALAAQQHAEIAAHLGEALWVAGNRREAREIWEQGKQWSPDDPVLLDTLERFSKQPASDV